jgi:hypothetical protein
MMLIVLYDSDNIFGIIEIRVIVTIYLPVVLSFVFRFFFDPEIPAVLSRLAIRYRHTAADSGAMWLSAEGWLARQILTKEPAAGCLAVPAGSGRFRRISAPCE